ncbi:SurA N-terminal domain-containing protein [Haloactinopolyspora alba]|uniref:SurA N-terminal domain-containing protein n=1 Tax=Haloactinopolyspora alba TaxID=648780 RepID=UPI0013EBE5DF|nr:SurA N-terminal domain-containing protein [Haloactinopolyspora alba]
MSTTRRIVPAALAVAAVVALSACDSDQVGAAAVVDGERFTVSELQDQVKESQQLEGFDVRAAGGVSGFQRELLTRHIQHEIFLRLAERENIDITQAQIDDAIERFESQSPDGNLGPALAQNGYTRESFRAGLTDQLIVQEYTSRTGADQAAVTQALVDLGEQLNIEVNPRYGSWGDQLAVTDDSGSISEPENSGSTPTPGQTPPPAAPPAQ